jgi:hypothetical protein
MMLRPEAENESEDNEGNCALLLWSEDEEGEAPAGLHEA